MLKENLVKGLRIICTENQDGEYETTNKIGTILGKYSNRFKDVEFDEDVEGHDCDGECEYGHGLRIKNDYLEPYNIYNERERI